MERELTHTLRCPTASAFDGRRCRIIRPLELDKEVDIEVGPMFRVEMEDGTPFDVFAEELDPTIAASEPRIDA